MIVLLLVLTVMLIGACGEYYYYYGIPNEWGYVLAAVFGLIVGAIIYHVMARGRYMYGGKSLPRVTQHKCKENSKHTLVYVDDYELAWLDKRHPGGKELVIDGDPTGINCYPKLEEHERPESESGTAAKNRNKTHHNLCLRCKENTKQDLNQAGGGLHDKLQVRISSEYGTAQPKKTERDDKRLPKCHAAHSLPWRPRGQAGVNWRKQYFSE